MKMAITKAILLLIVLSPLSQSSTNSTLSVGCIDDSDCVPLGHEYACYFYRCLNWMGGADTGLQHCSRDWQCGAGSRCYRHHNLREVSAGICFPASQLETCRSHEECEGETPHCCGMWCCPPLYYRLVGLPSAAGCHKEILQAVADLLLCHGYAVQDMEHRQLLRQG